MSTAVHRSGCFATSYSKSTPTQSNTPITTAMTATTTTTTTATTTPIVTENVGAGSGGDGGGAAAAGPLGRRLPRVDSPTHNRSNAINNSTASSQATRVPLPPPPHPRSPPLSVIKTNTTSNHHLGQGSSPVSEPCDDLWPTVDYSVDQAKKGRRVTNHPTNHIPDPGPDAYLNLS